MQSTDSFIHPLPESSALLLYEILEQMVVSAFLSSDCSIDQWSLNQHSTGNKTLYWLHFKGSAVQQPLPTEFHRKHGIPSDQSLLDYVVISGFKDSAFAVTVQHRNSTPELREFFERVDMESQDVQ